MVDVSILKRLFLLGALDPLLEMVLPAIVFLCNIPGLLSVITELEDVLGTEFAVFLELWEIQLALASLLMLLDETELLVLLLLLLYGVSSFNFLLMDLDES